jgi:hypothetical protein
LISVGFVVQFFDNVLWKEFDLDVYVHDSPSALAIGEYIRDEEGYVKDAEKVNDQTYSYETGFVSKVRSFLPLVCTDYP